jgi:uncharacterized protein
VGKTYHIPARALTYLIKAYQYLVSPLLGQCCRFYPSCSSYTIDAVNQHGFLHGSFIGMKRLLRCNPWARGGFDPVPNEMRHVD